MKALLAHPGTQHSARIAAQLFRRGLLGAFHTSMMIPERGLLHRTVDALPERWSCRFSSARRPAVPPELLHLHPWVEALAAISQRMGRSRQALLYKRNARFQQRIPSAEIAVAGAVIGFDTSGWILASRCREAGTPFILDQSIGHPDSKSRIFDELRQRYPAWGHDTETRLPEVRRAEQTEHELATCIVAPSSFSKQTLIENGVAAQKIKVNPFGVDASHFVAVRRRVPTMLRFVFVGSITARKGVAQLIEVWRTLNPKNAELWLVGPATPSVVPLVQGIPNVRYKGAFPHAELPSVLSECDVFVFPSFFEGFALVILEAMACGLPVITTPAAGADVIIEGENGWIVPTGDDAALTAAVERCLTHPEATREAGVHARRTAEECTWERYGERWADILSEIGQPADGRR